MPTIKQLPAAASVAAGDVLPISQGGFTRSVTAGVLLAGTQPALTVGEGKLLGRTSAGAGGPEPVALGAGLSLISGVLSATGGGGGGATVGTTAGTVAAGNDARIVGAAQRSANLADLASVTSARANLGLSAVASSGQFGDIAGVPAFVTAAGAQQAVIGTITVNGQPNAASSTIGMHLDVYNPGTLQPTSIVYATRTTYTNEAAGQTMYDFGHAVQAVWQRAPGVAGGQMFGQWTIAEGPIDSTSNYGIVGYEINPVNRGNDTGWTSRRDSLARFSVALQLVPEANSFTHGGTAQNITAALVIAQSPATNGTDFVRSHSGVLIEPNAIAGTVGRAMTMTGDVTGGPGAPVAATPWGPWSLLGNWRHGVDFASAVIFDTVALRLGAGQRVGFNNAAGTQTATIGSNEIGDVLLGPVGTGQVRAGTNVVWHAGNLSFGSGLSLSGGVLTASGGSGGTVGPQGPAGPAGPQGPIGTAGPVGATGAIGPAGAAGAIGPAGPTGATGATGAQGPAGPTGLTGAAGAQGAAGPAGPAGPQGATGPSGAGSAIVVTTIAASGASQTLTAPASGSVAYDVTLTANCTLSLAGGAGGQMQSITIFLRQDGPAGRVPILPAGVRWAGGVVPVPNSAAGGIDVFVFTTPDAGATWFGSY